MKRRVLILCTGNIARSQMAEGWWRRLGGEAWEVFSAGTRQNRSEVHPLALQVMAEHGVDISGQRPKPLHSFIDQSFDLVVTVCSIAEQDCPTLPLLGRREHWPMDDPAIAGGDPAAQLAIFRRLRDETEARIRSFLASAVAES